MEPQRHQLFTNLLEVLRPSSEGKDSTRGAFAACEFIPLSEGFSLPSFHVEGAGEFRLPLAANDMCRLRGVCKEASFGGSAARNDATVRHCWQVDASNLSFPGLPTFLLSTIQALATKAVGALGLWGAGLQFETELYKLLFYEAGGHFPFQRDTEKEKGVFATLLLQLPTEQGYKGGKFVVKHSLELKDLDCHMVSTVGFCSMVFSADCLLQLRKVESGTKLCLAFNLVNRDFSLDRARREFISDQVRKTEAELKPWMQEAAEGKWDVYGKKLAIPLDHLYDESDMCFAKLKGNDRIVAEVLKSCTDENNEQSLDLHFCLASKHQHGAFFRCHYCDHACMDPDHSSMLWLARKDIKFSDLMRLNGQRASEAFTNPKIDMETDLVSTGEDPFDSEPIERKIVREFNDSLCLTYRYDRVLLIAWPKALLIAIACECEGGVAGALELLEKSPEKRAPKLGKQVFQVVRYCQKEYFEVWSDDWSDDWATPRLLRLCQRTDMLENVLQIFQLLSEDLFWGISISCDGKDPFEKIGVRNAEVAKAIADTVQVHGWESLSSAVIELTDACAFWQGEEFAQLAEELKRIGSLEAGAQVKTQTIEMRFSTSGEGFTVRAQREISRSTERKRCAEAEAGQRTLRMKCRDPSSLAP